MAILLQRFPGPPHGDQAVLFFVFKTTRAIYFDGEEVKVGFIRLPANALEDGPAVKGSFGQIVDLDRPAMELEHATIAKAVMNETVDRTARVS